MVRRPPRSTRTDTLFPYTTRVRSAGGAIQFSAFSHSFGLLSRDRAVPNRLAIARMEALCRAVAADPRVTNGGFADLPQPPAQPGPIRPPEPRPFRTLRRTAEQAAGPLAHEVRYVRRLAYVTANTSRWGKIAGGVLWENGRESWWERVCKVV